MPITISGTILATLFLVMLCPIAPKGAQAEEVPTTTTEEVSTPTRVLVQPTLAIALSPLIDINAVPRSTGTFSYSAADLSIATNSREGYTVLMHGVDGTELTSQTSNSVIKSLDTTATPESFANNSWGVYVGDNLPGEGSTYVPVTASPSVIEASNTSAAEQTVKVAFGVKVDTGLEPGIYSNTVVISVVANPVEAVSLNDLKYMQNMTSEICRATATGTSKTLIDVRDGMSYSVMKFNDDNCWMQSNLALTLSTDKTLTPADSDVADAWTPETNTSSTLYSNTDVAGTNSWKTNNIFYYQFNAATAGTGVAAVADGDEATSSICPKGWKLPLGGTMNNTRAGSFEQLRLAYNSPSAQFFVNAPFNMSRQGSVRNGALQGVNADTIYWSRVVAYNNQDGVFAYGLDLGNTGVNGSFMQRRDYGTNVRCVAASVTE